MCGKACTTVYIYIDVQPKTDDIVTGSQMEWVIKFLLNTSKLQVGLMRQTGIIHVYSIQIDPAGCVIKSKQGVYII